MKSRFAYSCASALLLLGLVGTLAGCGGSGGSGSTARATIVLANDAPLSGLSPARGESGEGFVPLADIQSLTVSITGISLQTCGESDGEHGADENEDVHVTDFAFDPTCLTIEQGGAVRWEWKTDAEHTITSGSPGDPDAGALFDQAGAGVDTVVELVFADVGVYPYFSDTVADVEAGMAGTIKVVADDDADEPGDDDHSEEEEVDESELRHEGGEAENEGDTIPVFEGAFDVNLLDLTALSQVLTSAGVPAGKYCRIVLQIENPRLVLVADPATEITDVQLTANGRLFIKDRFEIAEGEEIIIVLNFGGIHLVQTGDGGYVLTPKIRAEVNAGEQETEIEGEISSIDPDAKIIVVQGHDGGVFEVLVSESTVIKSDDDSDDTEVLRNGEDSEHETLLTFEDLVVGQHVEVEGTLSEGGQLSATEIEIEDGEIEAEDEEIETPIV